MTKTINDIIIKIPAKIRKIADEHNLNRTDTETLAQIDYLNNQEGCTVTNKTLAVYLGKSAKTAQRIISKLQKLGLIVSNIVDHFQRTIKTTFEKVTKKLDEIVEKAKEGVGHLDQLGWTQRGDIFNIKQYKYFNSLKTKIETKVYQFEDETDQDFEARIESRRLIGGDTNKYIPVYYQQVNKNVSMIQNLKNQLLSKLCLS